jgi:hypothetical protein
MSVSKEKIPNIAVMVCRACGEKYDTPHKPNCPRRTTPSGRTQVLVKMNDLDN